MDDSPSSYFRGLKGALGVLGICSDLPAPPLAPLSEAERSAIRAHLEAINAFTATV